MSIALLLLLLIIPIPAKAVEYFATYEGTGTESDPFRAHSNIINTECTSLRLDNTRINGIALCSGPTLPVRAGVRQIDLTAPLTSQQKTFLASVLGRPITETTVGEVLSAIVDANAINLKRSRDGKQRLMVKGQEVWSRSAPLASYVPDILHWLNVAFHLPVVVPAYLVSVTTAWAATSVAETFTCPDDTDGTYVCDHTWTRYTGTAAAGIVSNTLRMTNAAATNLLYNSTALDSTDMLHRITIKTLTRVSATNAEAGPGVRHTGTSTSTYAFCVLRDAASPIARVGNVLDGVATEDGTVGVTIGSDDTLETRAVGDQLSCKHNGVTILGPLTDNTGSGNVKGMVRFSGSGGADSLATVDDSFAQVVTARRAVAPQVLQ